jgi:monoamine oxidase
MRQFIYLLSILVFSSCTIFKKHTTLAADKKIVIIGAGISGLSAAQHLKKKGFSPVVLEAQDRVGGRLRTLRDSVVVFDEGASWIHGPKGNPITKLAKKSKLDTFYTNDESLVVYDMDGRKYPQELLEEEEEKFNEILDELKGRRKKDFSNRFFKQYPDLKDERLWRYMLSAFLEFDTGGDIKKLSSKYFYHDEVFPGKDVIVTNGYDGIAKKMAEGIDIRLQTKVVDINYQGEKVMVKTNNGDFIADKVLVTLPLGVLKKGKVGFTPALPKRTQKAIDRLDMGTVNKFLLVWNKAFWDVDKQYIGYTAKEKGKFNYFLNVKKFGKANALMTFSFGEYSKTTESLSDQEIIDGVMSHLKNIYGPNIPYPSHFYRTKWNTNPYTYGAYSFIPKKAKNKDFKTFEKPIKGKIYFAGEHTSILYRGTVHGAYLSGIREAKKIVGEF